MVAVPLAWYSSLTFGGIDGTPLWQHLVAFGIALSLEGYFYRQLPVDLIPDFIPLIGRCDDCCAGMVVVFGVVIAMLGFGILAITNNNDMRSFFQTDYESSL